MSAINKKNFFTFTPEYFPKALQHSGVNRHQPLERRNSTCLYENSDTGMKQDNYSQKKLIKK